MTGMEDTQTKQIRALERAITKLQVQQEDLEDTVLLATQQMTGLAKNMELMAKNQQLIAKKLGGLK